MSMQQPERRQLGSVGVTAVDLFFKELGWGPICVEDQDLGTDIWVQLRDDGLRDSALMIGVQVKTGDSYFDSPGEVEGRKGYWYLESNQDHANYWVNCPIPHIIILQNEDRSVRLWGYATRETIRNTGKGFKVFIPEHQKLEPSHASAWTEMATKQLKRVSHEGSSWDFDLNGIAEPEYAIYSLLVPRLIAPHPNKGFSEPISWFQAIALCLQGRSDRWRHFAESHVQVPSPLEANGSDIWGWRFAAAVYFWTSENEITQIENLDRSPVRSHQIATAVFYSLALFEKNRFEEALKVLVVESHDDEYSVEQGWLSIHQSRILIEIGQLEIGRELAVKAHVQLVQIPANVVVSAIKGAVAWTLFETADWTLRDISSVASALDTFSSWWRTQAIASGLERVVEEQFRTWSQDTNVTFFGGSSAHNDLYSSALLAQLSGAHSQWRSSFGLLAMVDLMSGMVDRFGALDSLRRAGNEKSLDLAIRKILQSDPLDDLRRLVDAISPIFITRTTARTDLKILEAAGDYCTPGHATVWINFLLDSLEGVDPLLKNFFDSNTLITNSVTALSGLISFGDADVEDRSVKFLLSFPDDPTQLFDRPFTLLTNKLSISALERNRNLIENRLASCGDKSWYFWFLTQLLGKDNEISRPRIHDGLIEGLPSALEALGDVRDLANDEVEAVMRRCAEGIEVYHLERSKGSRGLGGQDWAYTYAVLAYHFPKLCDWNLLIGFLSDQSITSGRKRDTCKFLSQIVENIPLPVGEQIKVAIESQLSLPEEDSASFGLIPKIGGAMRELYLRLIGLNHTVNETIVGQMLIGDGAQRADAIDYLASKSGFETTLLAMATDKDDRVSNRAVGRLSQLVSQDASIESVYLPILRELSHSGGESVIYAIIFGLTSTEPIRPLVRGLLSEFLSHPSIAIRNRVASALSIEGDEKDSEVIR